MDALTGTDHLPEAGVNNIWYHHSNSDLVLVFVHGVLSDSRSCWLNENTQPAIYWPALIRTDQRLPEMDVYMGGYYTAIDAGAYEVRN